MSITGFYSSDDHGVQQTTAAAGVDSIGGCGGHGKWGGGASAVCVCDPCWSGPTCSQYVDVHQPRFLVNNLYRVITTNTKGGPVFRAEVTDDDLGLTCPLHGPGEATTCPCAKVTFTLISSPPLFTVDNETGDVFMVRGAQLTPGRQYSLTLHAHGLEETWRGDVMRAVLYVSHDVGFMMGTPRALVRKTRQAKRGGRVSVELTRSEENSLAAVGSVIPFKVRLRSSTGCEGVVLEIAVSSSNGSETTALALCNVTSASQPKIAPPKLITHQRYYSMFVGAVFELGVVPAELEISFDAIVTKTTDQLQYISATLSNGETAQINVSLPNNKAEDLHEQELEVESLVRMSPDLMMMWAVTTKAPSADLGITIADVTPRERGLFRVGNLSLSHVDDRLSCMAIPRAILTPIDKILARLYIPVYTIRGTGGANRFEFSSWLLPESGADVISIQVSISSAGVEWTKIYQINKITKPTRLTLAEVQNFSSVHKVPRRVPVFYQIKIKLLESGTTYNLTMVLQSQTKGLRPVSMVVTHLDELLQGDLLGGDDTKMISKNLVAVASKAGEMLAVRVCLVAENAAAAGPARAQFSVEGVATTLNLTIDRHSQAIVVTPSISVVPHDDQLGFGIQFEIPGGSCTESLSVDVDGLGASFCRADFVSEHGVIAFNNNSKWVNNGVELGRLCSAQLREGSAVSATLRLLFTLEDGDTEVRMRVRVRSSSWSWSGESTSFSTSPPPSQCDLTTHYLIF